MTAFDDGMDRTVAAGPLERATADPDAPMATPEPDTERLWMRDPQSMGRASFEVDTTGPNEGIPSVAQITGHPLHPAIIPLPIGAFAGAFLSDVAFAATHDRFWARASQTLLGAGIVTGLLAGSLGALDFVGRERIRSHGSAWIHAGGNVAAVLLASLSLGARRRDGEGAIVPSGLVATSLIAIMLAVTGWLGGELTFRHKIGQPEDA